MKKIFYLFVFLLVAFVAKATHNQAGDITYENISGLTYEFTITIFADGNSPAVGRKEIEINWGDNTGLDSLNVISETQIGPNTSTIKRVWRGRHTFPGPGSYFVRVEDPNRNGGVDNIDNSVNVPFVIETLLRISPFANQPNNSVVLRNDPVDIACVGATYVYNPGAIDFDGDSVAYALARSKGTGGQTAPGYEFPPASNSITVNPLSGDLVWDQPNVPGLYNVAITIKEFRNGVLVSEVLRDLQITVIAGCNNQPPVIQTDQSVCVDAGSTLTVPIRATDPDVADDITISATGEVLEPPINNRTNFNRGVISNPANASFIWNTNCSDVRNRFYYLSIRAEDNGQDRGTRNLVHFKTVDILVVAPAPTNVSATDIGTAIELNWDNTTCQNAIGYIVYRRLDSSGYVSDSCNVGVPENIGYAVLDTIIGLNNTNYLDDNFGEGLIPGQKYCYLITKFFADGAESYASEEVCAKVKKIVPVITKVSVLSTSNNAGVIDLGWSPPDTIDIVAYPPPYRYLISSRENDQKQLIDSTLSLVDTIYTVSNLNTESMQHSFQVDLFSLGNGRVFAGKSAKASSIFLKTNASDNQIELNWSDQTPWVNDSFIVYRSLPNSSSIFDSIAVTSQLNYIDSNLKNDSKFCYYIESFGAYNLNSVEKPLINLSQVACDIPLDTVIPCSPILSASGTCENEQLDLIWNNPNNTCGNDIIAYNLYRSVSRSGEKELIRSFTSPLDTTLRITNEEVAGCYFVTSLDSALNESEFSSSACLEYCPIYELPNVFTPNGDAHNELFIPIQPYRYVDSIDLNIYNRWGDLVFHTTNPDIEWNGERLSSINLFDKNKASDGVFFYSCKVFELSVEDNKKPRLLKGTITVLDSKFIKVE
ncbi:MAG: gliding motility-associated C-terminal domain-containing protein [Vicingaceae bacterium]